jgi:hypothetical protein
MALHQPNSSIKQHIVTVFRDQEGNEIHSTVYSEEVTRLPDGSVVTEKSAENYALVSGELTNPSQAAALPVGVCALCGATPSILPWQRRTTTRLCSMEHLKHCVSCGRPLCPRHRKRSEKDRKWRCLSCHRKHWWASLLSPLFFEEVEE